MVPTRVLVLYTGAKDDVLRYIPGIGERDGIHWELLSDPALPPVDSSGIRAKDWLNMAPSLIASMPTGTALSFFMAPAPWPTPPPRSPFLCETPGKPVVLTGSQTPLFHHRTDGRLHLIHALRIAGHRATGIPLVPEAVICFGKRVVRGNRARKMSTTDSDAFDSPNLRPYAPRSSAR